MIIGITGTLASGKDTVAQYLVKELGFTAYSLSDELRAEAQRAGKPKDRDSLYEVGRALRAEAGPAVLAQRTLERVRTDGAARAVVISLRILIELEIFLKEEDFYLVDIDAPVEARYRRMQARGSEKDIGVTFERFTEQEESEKKSGAAGLELDMVRERADYRIDNGGSFEDLYHSLDKIMDEIEALKRVTT